MQRLTITNIFSKISITAVVAGLAAFTVVRPCAASTSEEALLALAQPLADYKLYVADLSEKLVADTARFVEAIEAGDIDKAKTLYAPTRMSYEAIEPIAELFSDIDVAVDSRADDWERREQDPGFGGFHRIEYGLWAENSTDGLTPYAQKLMADVSELNRRIFSLTFPAEDVLEGASDLMNEVASTKVTGEEDRYSHTDLYDFKANFDGSREIFELTRPLIEDRYPDFVARVLGNFRAVDQRLDKYRSGDGWVTYDQVSSDDVKALTVTVNTLAEDLATLRAKLGVD